MEIELDFPQVLVSTFITFVLWGLFQYLLGLLWQQTTQIFPILTLYSLISLVIAFAVVFGLWSIVNLKIGPVIAVQAYLFFPRPTPDENKTIEYHKNHLSHRVIVNFKTVPPKAYYLPVGSYAWKLVKKRTGLWIPEVDHAPKDPDSIAKWCASRNYRLEPRAPTRKDLQEIAETNRQDLLDRRLVHVEARNFHYQLLTFKTLIGRAVLNWETMMAFTLDDWTLNLVKEGKIRSHDVTVIPLIFRAKGWAEERHFTWSDKLPTMKDLLAKKEHK